MKGCTFVNYGGHNRFLFTTVVIWEEQVDLAVGSRRREII
jgi:hypothetical protein